MNQPETSLDQQRLDGFLMFFKFMIRGRDAVDPSFMAPEAYTSWTLNRAVNSCPRNASRFLKAALKELTSLVVNGLLQLDSAAIDDDDALEGLVYDVLDFTDDAKIKQAIQAIEKSQRVSWDKIAKWDDLPSIRRKLNAFRDSLKRPIVDGPEPPNWVRLNGKRFRVGNARASRSWKLLKYFWDHERATYEELQGPDCIWDDPVNDTAVASAVSRFNKEVPAELDWELKTGNRYVFKEQFKNSHENHGR